MTEMKFKSANLPPSFEAGAKDVELSFEQLLAEVEHYNQSTISLERAQRRLRVHDAAIQYIQHCDALARYQASV